jgi:hypothetical protein
MRKSYVGNVWPHCILNLHNCSRVNCYNTITPQTPFGGYKESGIGREMWVHVHTKIFLQSKSCNDSYKDKGLSCLEHYVSGTHFNEVLSQISFFQSERKQMWILMVAFLGFRGEVSLKEYLQIKTVTVQLPYKLWRNMLSVAGFANLKLYLSKNKVVV